MNKDMPKYKDISSLGISEMLSMAINHSVRFHMVLLMLKCNMYSGAKRMLGIN